MPRKNRPVSRAASRPLPTPHTKRKYRSEGDAMKTAELQMLIHPELELSTYWCDECHAWHLTRQPRR